MASDKMTLSIATSAAIFALAMAAPASAGSGAHSDGANVPCYGVNSCKGESDCKTARNECKGQNSCKGEGFKEMSKKACAAAGGSLKAPK